MQFLALISMIIDHIGTQLFQHDQSILIITGLLGIALPVMASYIVTGVNRTRNLNKYIYRVFLIGLFAQPAWMLLKMPILCNDVLSLCLGMCLIKLHQKNKLQALVIFGVLSLFLSSSIISVIPYGLVYSIYVLRKTFLQKYGEYLSIIIYGLITVLAGGFVFITWFLVPVLLELFKGKEFRVHRYLKYSIYPAHFYILFLIQI